jgi:hypothetical protein
MTRKNRTHNKASNKTPRKKYTYKYVNTPEGRIKKRFVVEDSIAVKISVKIEEQKPIKIKKPKSVRIKKLIDKPMLVETQYQIPIGKTQEGYNIGLPCGTVMSLRCDKLVQKGTCDFLESVQGAANCAHDYNTVPCSAGIKKKPTKTDLGNIVDMLADYYNCGARIKFVKQKTV